MKGFIDKFGQWLRHKIRVILFKQWKKPIRIYKNLHRLKELTKAVYITDEDIYATANTRLGLYRQAGMKVANFLITPYVLGLRNGDRPGLVDPLEYYLR